MIAFVDPPAASKIRMALSKASVVSMLEGRIPLETRSTAVRPDSSARIFRRESAPGTAAPPGSDIPSVSTIAPIVEAVPITMQCPGER